MLADLFGFRIVLREAAKRGGDVRQKVPDSGIAPVTRMLSAHPAGVDPPWLDDTGLNQDRGYGRGSVGVERSLIVVSDQITARHDKEHTITALVIDPPGELPPDPRARRGFG